MAPMMPATTPMDVTPNPGVFVLGCTPEYAVGAIDNHLFLNWRQRIIVDGGHDLRRGFEMSVERHPERQLNCLVTVQPGCHPYPDPELRSAITEIIGDYHDAISGLAMVFEGTGFEATILRSVTTVVHLASRARFANRVFANTAAATTWLATQGRAPHLGPHRLAAAVEYLRIC